MSREITQFQPFCVKLLITNSADHITGAGSLETSSLSAVFQMCKETDSSFITRSRGCINIGGGWYSFSCTADDSNTRGDLIVRVPAFTNDIDPAERLLWVGGETKNHLLNRSWVYSATATGFEISVHSLGKISVVTTPSEVKSWSYF